MIYFDNSATSYPKPKCVERAVHQAYRNYFANGGRGSSRDALRSAKGLYEAREAVAMLVNTLPENIIFTYNATYALNIAIQGILKEGDRVACDRFAHNSVLRPLYALEKKGVSLEILDTHLSRDSILIAHAERLVRERKLDCLVLTHTSNVTGKMLPVKRLARICKDFGVTLILDASQGVGYGEIDMEELGADIIASSGHKGLYGIMGSGFIAIRRGFDTRRISPVISGGSGILSLYRDMPDTLPERLEAGTLSPISAASMRAGAEFIRRVGAYEIGERVKRLRSTILEDLSVVRGVTLYNADVNAKSIVLFNLDGMASEELAYALDLMGIEGRAGYHCAPLVHEMIGGGDENYKGAMRISLGYFNTPSECKRLVSAVNRLSREKR